MIELILFVSFILMLFWAIYMIQGIKGYVTKLNDTMDHLNGFIERRK